MRRTTLCCAVLGFAVLFLTLDIRNAASQFRRETVEPSITDLVCLDLVTDTTDRVHMAYYDPALGELGYALRENGRWSTRRIDGVGSEGYASIDVDSADSPHILYYDGGDLREAWFAQNAWWTGLVDIANDAGRYVSMRIDGADAIHVAYEMRRFGLGDLRYATNASGSWAPTTVGPGGIDASLALDSSNQPRILHGSSSMLLAIKSAGVWTTETVALLTSSGPGILDIDSADRPVVVYPNHESSNYKVEMATRNALDDWTVVLLTVPQVDPMSVEDFAYANDRNHVVYSSSNPSALGPHYLYWPKSGVLESAPLPGEISALTVDTAGTPHLGGTIDNRLSYLTYQFREIAAPLLLWTQSISWGDYDDDGDDDAYVVRQFGNVLLQNVGGGNFEDVTRSPLGNNSDGIGSAWGDYDNDGKLDLYLINNQAPNRLFRNEGLGNFSDAKEQVLEYVGNSRDATWVDYDNDGDLDLYLACQNEPNKLYNNDHGVFSDASAPPLDDAGPTVDVAWGDPDDDGDMDLYLVQAGTNDKYMRNMGGVFFVEFVQPFTSDTRIVSWIDDDNEGVITYKLALPPTVDEVWHDLDNDGWIDGYSSNELGGSGYSPNVYQQNLMDGSYQPMSFGPLNQWTSGTGAVTGADIDGDGDIDLALDLPGAQGIKLFLNDISERHWLQLRLEGVLSPRDGQGAKVILRTGGMTQMRQVGGGNGLRGHDTLVAHFGLGSTASVDTVEIRWPSGVVQILEGLAVDTTHDILEQGTPVIPPWSEVHSLEFTTGQLARASSWVDYDSDNDLDLFVSHLFQPNPMLRNDGGDVFTQISTAPLNTAGNPSAAWGDYDNDGDEDLLAPSSWSTNPIFLFRNDGAGVFTDATTGLLTTPGEYWRGSWVELARDGNLSIHIQRTDGTGQLLRESAGTFIDWTPVAFGSIVAVSGYAWADFNGDGELDVFMHRDIHPNLLYKNIGFGFFQEVASGPLRDFTQGQGSTSISQPTWVDYDGDGDLDLYILLMTFGDFGEAVLIRNDGNNNWSDVTSALNMPSPVSAQGWLDYDNDGLLDLVSLGGFEDIVQHRSGPSSFDQTIILPAAGGTGYSIADYDEDGDVDIFTTTITGENHLFKNNQNTGFHWLEVELLGVRSNRTGIGATVRIVAGGVEQIQSHPSAGPSLGQNSPRLHFGLNSNASVDSIIVTWPSAFKQYLTNIPADQILTVEEDVPDAPFELVSSYAGGDARGVAVGDYDNDGWEDAYITWASQSNLLLHGDGSALPIASGPVVEDPGNGRGAAWADVDNDRDLDLFLVNKNSSNKLFANDGSGGFTDITNGTTSNSGDGSSVAWADFDNDGFVDLYLVNSLEPNLLLKNFAGSGNFTSVFNPLLNDAGDGRGASWADFDFDGDQDLYLANSGSTNKLFRNDGGGAFTDIAAPVLSTGGGRGVAWADYDNDEDLDLYVGGGNSAGQLFRNLGGGIFDIVVDSELATLVEARGVAWGDYDNDGWIDLYIVQAGTFRNELLRNLGNGQFDMVGTGVVNTGSDARGCAWLDIDGDGDLDLIVINSDVASQLFKNNVGQSSNWIRVRCVGTVSNAAAIGARVRIVTAAGPQIREVSGGSGLYSQNPLPVHFGLGSVDVVDTLEVFWPSGIVQQAVDVDANRQLTIVEDAASTSVDEIPEAILRTRLFPNLPNPFNPRTLLRFDLASEGPVQLVVYDSMGRHVRTLLESRLASGRHEATWSGIDARGRAVASGVYFARLTATDQSAVVRMVLVR